MAPEQSSQSLEDREIRGINFKLVRAFTLGTVSIVAAVMISYFKLNNLIEKSNMERASNERYINLYIENMKMSFQSQINDLAHKIEELKKTIK